MLLTDRSAARLARGESFSSLINAVEPLRDDDDTDDGATRLPVGLSSELGRCWLVEGGLAPMLASESVERLLGGRW